MSKQIGLIGFGNMGSAIVTGAAALDVQWLVADQDDAKQRSAWRAGAAKVVERAGALLELLDPAAGDQLMLAVKPQALPAVAEELRAARFDGVVISILAGAGSRQVRQALGGSCRVIRVMPNTAAAVGQAMSAVAIGAGAQAGDQALAMQVMQAIGEVVELEEELMDAFTAVAGSGPAYLFLLAEAMVTAALQLDLPPQETPRIVGQTLLGAASLLRHGSQSAEQLRQAVTSPGGTTAAAMEVLFQAGWPRIIEQAITAARNRGAELGR